MPVIGVVDDRVDARAVAVDSLTLALPESWEVVPIDPLTNLSEYSSWISANKISVLIIDERLNEASTSDEGAVSYFGHDLVKYLRKRMGSFPIFVVTSYPNDEDLRERFGDVEDIIDRKDFSKATESYAARFARASQRYLETFERELAELSGIAIKAASGADISEAERTRVKAIQEKINVAFSFDEIDNRSQWISQMETTVQEFEQLRQDIEALLEGGNNNEVEENS